MSCLPAVGAKDLKARLAVGPNSLNVGQLNGESCLYIAQCI
jgi:hypothetical protein